MVRAEARRFAEHVMMNEGKGLGSTFDHGYARPHAPEPQRYERTPEQKAAGAKTVADNFDQQLEHFAKGASAAVHDTTDPDVRTRLANVDQVLEDAQQSGFVEVSRNSVLNDPAFVGRFRPELVETTVATRAFARGERPVTGFGMEVGNVIGDEIVRVLTGELTAQEAMRVAEQRVAALGLPD